MIDMMAEGEQAAGVFVSAFPAVSQPAISQHLKVLRDSGIARVRTDRQRRMYSLVRDRLDPVREWLMPHVSGEDDLSGPKEQETPAPQAKRGKAKARPAAELTLDLFG